MTHEESVDTIIQFTKLVAERDRRIAELEANCEKLYGEGYMAAQRHYEKVIAERGQTIASLTDELNRYRDAHNAVKANFQSALQWLEESL